MAASEQPGEKPPQRPTEPFPVAQRRKHAGHRFDRRLRSALPRPAYEFALHRYHDARRLAGKNPGRGRALPDFLIIGAAKAGTTSLYKWLGDHPSVVPAGRKEINFFSYFWYRGSDWYRSHFPLERDLREHAGMRPGRQLTGEASPSYLLHYRAPERARKLVPDVKLIVQLRDPVDRAYSQFQMRRRDGEEPLESFAAAVEAEPARLAAESERMLADPRYSSDRVATWSYLMRSRYAEQLERWLAQFPRHQIHVLSLEEMEADPRRVVSEVHEFLGLPERPLEQLPVLFTSEYEPLPAETRALLEEYFRPHNARLYELLGRDFGWDQARQPVGA